MTDEGWQIFAGLESTGYHLYGFELPNPERNVLRILGHNPGVVVVQDKREWDPGPHDFREQRARFMNVHCLAERSDVFKVTIVKDAQQNPGYHAASAREMGCHAWIVYYHFDRVVGLAPYLRRQHLIRTHHTVDKDVVPDYTPNRLYGCLLSGAISSAYPLRERLQRYSGILPNTISLRHPGYHRNGCATPGFLQYLTNFKVAICTASKYDYALRKIMEATAAGCVVITNLSEEDYLPEIDPNLIRIPSSSSVPFVADLIRRLVSEYDPVRQAYFAETCRRWYDFREEGKRLAERIEALRLIYGSRHAPS
jgi:hypothetical protein